MAWVKKISLNAWRVRYCTGPGRTAEPAGWAGGRMFQGRRVEEDVQHDRLSRVEAYLGLASAQTSHRAQCAAGSCDRG